MIKLPNDSATYFPAAGPQFESTYWKTKYKDFGFKWFLKGQSFFHYPYMLTNAFNNISYKNYRDGQEFPRDPNHILIGDSGGFQIVSYAKKGINVNIEPISILRWLENNCDIGMNLDFPLLDNFNHSLSHSVENFGVFESSRNNYDIMLCNVLHGRNKKELETWYKSVCNFDFDGWAIGVKPADNIYLQLYAYLLLHSNGAKGLENYCHFFGVASIRNMVILAILTKKLGYPVGFDASSYNVGSTAREFFMPENIGGHYYLGSKNSERFLTGMLCDCPVCRNININDIYEDSGGSGVLICLHNLYVTIETNRVINCLAKDHKNLLRYTNTMIRKDINIVRNINNILNDYIESGHDMDMIYTRYEELFILGGDKIPASNLNGIK